MWTNLIDNAVDAMEGSGTLRISTRLDGDEVVVEIADTGPGMPLDVQARAFDPFFTTKDVGKGTGLGLDISRRIVEDGHGGHINIGMQPDETVLSVRLRCVAPNPSVLGHQQLEPGRHLVGDLDHAVHDREARVEVALLRVAKALDDEVAALMVQPVELEVGGVAEERIEPPDFFDRRREVLGWATVVQGVHEIGEPVVEGGPGAPPLRQLHLPDQLLLLLPSHPEFATRAV